MFIDEPDFLEYKSMEEKKIWNKYINKDFIKDGCVLYKDGTKKWYKDGKLHCNTKDKYGVILPAIEMNDGTKEWWMNGLCHRDSGLPAVQFYDTKLKKWVYKWFWFGQEVSSGLSYKLYSESIKKL